ncbi:hypothetical protein L6452_14166 [Arctium lappa]|uniref:Uncharacterized protein n=1 Tax=Arctium lappa TaxID=4217 RepID=A0ACB9CKA5_ARCLA|nr:hypothetical protein L6452_14166 [Arctium lappa]
MPLKPPLPPVAAGMKLLPIEAKPSNSAFLPIEAPPHRNLNEQIRTLNEHLEEEDGGKGGDESSRQTVGKNGPGK